MTDIDELKREMAEWDDAPYIHPLAFVAEAKIGKRTRIYQFATVIKGARVGEDTVIGPCSLISASVIGDRCSLQHGVGCGPGFKIGNDVFMGPNATLCNDAWPRTNKAHWEPELLGPDGTHWAVIIEDGASIGVGASIMPGVIIGAGAMIGANEVVRESVPARMMLADGRLSVITPDQEARRLIGRMKLQGAATRLSVVR